MDEVVSGRITPTLPVALPPPLLVLLLLVDELFVPELLLEEQAPRTSDAATPVARTSTALLRMGSHAFPVRAGSHGPTNVACANLSHI